jgi:hypothetical protein
METGKYQGNIVEKNGQRYIEMSRENYSSFKEETREVREIGLRSVSFNNIYERNTEVERSRRLRPRGRLRLRNLNPFRSFSFRTA